MWEIERVSGREKKKRKVDMIIGDKHTLRVRKRREREETVGRKEGEDSGKSTDWNLGWSKQK